MTRRQQFHFFLTIVVAGIFALLTASCAGQKTLGITPAESIATTYSGYLVVSTVATDPATGPGLVSLFAPDGIFVRYLYDFLNTDFASGHGFFSPDELLFSIEGGERLERYSLTTHTNTILYANAGNLTANPLRHVAVSSVDGSMYVVEGNINTVEKFTRNPDGSYSRAGAPYIPTTVVTGAQTCALTSPWGITHIPSTNQVAVISSAASGRLSIYNNDGTCALHLTSAPLNANTPQAIAYHAPSNKFIISFVGNHSIYAMNLDGTGGTQIYLNSSIINTPRALATDAEGNIYVGSSGTDTVEKLYYNGTDPATRPLPGPLIGPRGTSANPTSITVIP